MDNTLSSGRTVLIAEDSVAQRRFLEILLSKDGHKVVSFEDGFTALQFLENNVPDLIVMDINMPYMNGLEASENIKSQKRLKHIPIILLSSFEEDISDSMLENAGADVFMAKPLASKAFRELTHNYLN